MILSQSHVPFTGTPEALSLSSVPMIPRMIRRSEPKPFSSFALPR